MQQKQITIAGAGLVGSLLGIYLAKRGYKVSIYERRSDMRKESISAGRSINLALSDRGILALSKVGLDQEIKNISIPMHGRYIHNLDGTTAFQPYGKQGQFINSVSRATLNIKLMDLAEKEGIEIHFNHKCTNINWNTNEIVFETESDKKVTKNFDLLFGADGAYSATRLQHQIHHSKFDYQQHYIDCGYKELTIPPTAENNFALEVNALHIWPRKDYMLIGLPNLDKTFTCTLFFPFDGATSFSNLITKEKVVDFFEKNFPDAIKLMPNYVDEFFNNPTSSLVTVKCYPWIREDKFALIGDAAHAVVPFFGQGMNCGFEDCRILDELIEANDDNWENILEAYQQNRKPNADAIADLAVENFTEMRAKTADPKFLLQKKIEAKLHQKYPNKWIPAYALVTFSPNISYSNALKQGKFQEEIMKQIMQIDKIDEIWDTKEIEEKIISMIG
jgi:kynurenine 3-monooxygenase